MEDGNPYCERGELKAGSGAARNLAPEYEQVCSLMKQVPYFLTKSPGVYSYGFQNLPGVKSRPATIQVPAMKPTAIIQGSATI